ncbi:matrix remodeling-associated protein 8-like isoform X1 [Anabas testudineus]|uniref:matrix remodeling-associated protein 8-like isoform X1 n=1 Tax=Anabas testudineus TaxID=64144 RepID=UPI00143D9835|nr:matrix remodeling-associated protein 8-like isoform X1 [Anabas testudineus]
MMSFFPVWITERMSLTRYSWTNLVCHMTCSFYHSPSFHGRMQLRDPTMTDGDYSVIMKNVNMNDAGTYNCYVEKWFEGTKKSSLDLISIITLKVEEHIYITVKSGDRVTLPCRGYSRSTVTAVKWIRPDLEQAGHVFMFQDGRSVIRYPDNQHPYYENWVELKDTEMKNGDVSLIIKNVTTSDSGTYECYVNQGQINLRRGLLMKLPPSST